MSKQKSRHTHFTLEDYNATTEPVGRVILPPVEPSSPFPQLPPGAGYSAWPPASSKEYHRWPSGGSAAYGSARVKRYRRSPISGLVRVGLLLVQLVLLARLVCLVLNIQATTPWLVLLFAAGDLFVEPIRWFAAQINLAWLTGTALLTDLEFVVAILAYGLLSWLLVRILRIVLNY